jgi:hypothetical protein
MEHDQTAQSGAALPANQAQSARRVVFSPTKHTRRPAARQFRHPTLTLFAICLEM